MFFFVTGLIMLAVIIGLFWLKDRLASPLLARIAYSELIARLALVGGAFSVIGVLLILAKFVRHW